MRPRLSRSVMPRLGLAFACACACALMGCVSRYAMPGLNEPHALVKLRRVFHSSPGRTRQVRVLIDGDQLLGRTELCAPGPAQTDVVRIRPGASRLVFEASFWHEEMRLETESYWEKIPYTDVETYQDTEHVACSKGQSEPCTRSVTRTRTVTKYRSELRTREVWKSVTVMDDECSRFAVRAFQETGVYLLQYTYTGASSCTITCLKQEPGPTPEGSVFRPCPLPPDPTHAADERAAPTSR